MIGTSNVVGLDLRRDHADCSLGRIGGDSLYWQPSRWVRPRTSFSGTLSIAVGAGAAHNIAVAAGTTGAALAAQINGDSTYSTAGVTAAYNSTTGALTISGPAAGASNLSFTGTSLSQTTVLGPGAGVDFTGC